MRYRIIKRSWSDGKFCFVIQMRWWIFPWKDYDGYSTEQYYFNTLEQAEKQLGELKVFQLKDVPVDSKEINKLYESIKSKPTYK